MGKILVVDDEPNMRRILVSNLRQEKHELVEAEGVGVARRALVECCFDAVITDQKMADGEGFDVLAAAHETDPALSVVFLTAFATVELAVETMRLGAFDFIAKPFVREALLAAAARAVEHTLLLRENGRLRDTVLRLEGELRNFVERACIRSPGEQITEDNFPVAEPTRGAHANDSSAATALTPDDLADLILKTPDLREFLASLERTLIQRLLKMTGGAQAEVARRLGMSRTDLSYKLGLHRIKSPTN